jgi:hypothetical protein
VLVAIRQVLCTKMYIFFKKFQKHRGVVYLCLCVEGGGEGVGGVDFKLNDIHTEHLYQHAYG